MNEAARKVPPHHALFAPEGLFKAHHSNPGYISSPDMFILDTWVTSFYVKVDDTTVMFPGKERTMDSPEEV